MKKYKYLKVILWILAGIIALCILTVGFLWLYLPHAHFGFSREVSNSAQRLELLEHATAYLGVEEGSDEHHSIIDTYNSHEPLAQGYEVTYTDNWCATFGSAVAIELDLTDIVPTECGCERQTELWKDAGRWEENDNYMPLPGDYIYYAWDERFSFGDCTGWADHVGIVVGTAGPFIKVIEGNRDDMVTYRIILRGNWQIRGYGLPDYAAK